MNANTLYRKVLHYRGRKEKLRNVMIKEIGGEKPWRKDEWDKHRLNRKYKELDTLEKVYLRAYTVKKFGDHEIPNRFPRRILFPRS